jgi:hypothetical protein
MKFVFQLASDLHLQTHLRGTRHNQLLIERFNQKNDNGIKKQPTQTDLVDNFYLYLFNQRILFFRMHLILNA